MADIELVIKIDEEIYQKIKETNRVISGRRNGERFDYILFNAVNSATPLPKGHGRIMDADKIIKKMEEREEQLKDNRSMYETSCVETALDMFGEIIIDADKAESEEL